VAALEQQGPSPVNAISRDGEEEILGVEVLVDEMHPTLLRRGALFVAVFHKARVLRPHVSTYNNGGGMG